jgi:hypothetical protein
MNVPKWVSPLFALAALYDGVLGLLFLAAPGYPFQLFEVTQPNHLGYVQFPAALLLIFALMFAAVARSPVANRNLIPYGILLKLAYCGVTFAYWFTSGIPTMWKPLAIVDLAMAVLFGWAYAIVCRRATE